MWCPHCQIDVAAEVSPHTGDLVCCHCRASLEIRTPTTADLRSDAHKLLQRWADSSLLDPKFPAANPVSDPTLVTLSPNTPPTAEPAPTLLNSQLSQVLPQTIPFEGPKVTPLASHSRHASTPPEFATNAHPVPPVIRQRPESMHHAPEIHDDLIPPSGRADTRLGQFLAYLGIATLTIGTTLVVWDYLSAARNPSPTGWLIVVAGQMFLFLGIVNLVSGGLQQTHHQLAVRFHHLHREFQYLKLLLDASSPPRTPSESLPDQLPPVRPSAVA